MTITQLIVCIVAGLGAGLGTGLAGLSAAAVVSPMLITFLHMPAYQAIGIALASDVLASGVSAWTYKKNKNIDIRHGVIMLISVLIFTLVGSFVSSLVPNGTMGGFSKVMTLFVGLKFIIRPIMTTKEVQANKSEKQKIQQSILCGVVIGFIPYGFILPVIARKCRSGFFIILSGFGISLLVETIQLITKVGCFDVDDLILNTLGAALGYLAFAVCNYLRRKCYGKKI